MHLSTRARATIAAACLAAATWTVGAQERERAGPPPEIRALLDALVEALNGEDAGAWEAFAQTYFVAALLEQQTRDERAARHRQLAGDLGRATLEGVRRKGPGAPLELHVRGAAEDAVIVLDLASESPPRVSAMRVRLGEGPRDAEAGAVPLPPIDGSLAPAEIDRRLDGYFTALAAVDVFSGAVLVAHQGVPVFFKAYGFADRDARVPNTTDTRFNIGSINKTFTQAAVRQLVAEGRVAYTDTLGTFFPDYPQAASRAATVEQLLGHRAGIADFFGPAFSRADKAQFASNADYFRFVSTLPPVFAPGERNQYCNGCYIVLGAIVEHVAGMPYERYVGEKIFGPAGMMSTGSLRSDRPEPGVALGYTRRGADGSLQPNVGLHGVAGSAAGGGYSTARDLLAYAEAVRAGRFPGMSAGMGVAGGAPGINAVLEMRGEWVTIVLTNLDPPTGERLGVAIADALSR
jgi:D-alanyl-D-alanine carboxypeptidase